MNQESTLLGFGEEGIKELFFNGHRVSIWDEERVLKMDSGDDCTTL